MGALVGNIAMLTSYDTLKKYNEIWIGTENKQFNRFFSGALSGWIASTLMLPFDFIKTRIQHQVKNSHGEFPYKNIIHCAITVKRDEGLRVFFKGYIPFVC